MLNTIIKITFCLLLSFHNIAQTDSLNFLKIGDKAPNFSVISHNQDSINLNQIVQKGKVVIVFYRGAWCPYCNKFMSHLQDSLNLLLEKGATILAISPEIDESIEKTISKTKASFSIIHDMNYSIMKQYGVAFKVDDKTLKKHKLFGIDLEETNANSDGILPVPATFIINQDNTIQFVHFDPDYKKRVPISEILKHL